MAKFDVGFKLESAAQAVDIRWRRSDETTWTAVGVFSTSPAVLEVPDDTGAFSVNVRAAGADRRPVDSGATRRGDTYSEPLNRPDLATAIAAAPAVRQDGPTLKVTPAVPDGFEADEYDIEVRVSDTSTADAEDALQVGFVDPGQEAVAVVLAGESSQRIHHRLRRKETGRTTGWATKDVEISSGEMQGTKSFDTDFAAGSFPELLPGFEPLEINAGNIRFAGISLDDLGSVSLDDLATVSLDDLGEIPTQGTFRTPVVTLDAEDDLQFQVSPTLASTLRADWSLDDLARLPLHWPEDQATGFVDHRIRNMGRALAGDRSPVQVEVSVATSTSEAPTFTDNDFVPYRDGEVRRTVRSYALDIKILSPYGAQLTFSKLDVRHWVFCKSRPWCHVSRTYELIDEVKLAAAAATLDLTVDGQRWSELVVEATWINEDASAAKLKARYNGSGSNEIVLGDTAVASGDTERVVFTVRPQTGERRRALISERSEWSGATPASVNAGQTVIWDESATAITSIRLLTDQTAGFSAATCVRLYGRREYGA